MSTQPCFDLTIADTADGLTLAHRGPDGAEYSRALELPQELLQSTAAVELGSLLTQADDQNPRAQALAIGRTLEQALFTGDTLTHFRAARQAVSSTKPRLLVRLDIPPSLEHIPWEFLADPRDDYFLVLAEDISLVRTAVLQEIASPPAMDVSQPQPLHIVAIYASPKDGEPIEVEREQEVMRQMFGGYVKEERARLDIISEAGTYDQLNARVRQPPHVIHILCHGKLNQHTGQGELLFESEHRDTEKISAQDLRFLLRKTPGITQLLVLNACLGARPASPIDPYSSVALSLVRAGVPAVIAMRYAVSTETAATLAKTLYDALVDGEPVDSALAEVRLKLHTTTSTSLDWAIPVLFLAGAHVPRFELPPPRPVDPRSQIEIAMLEEARSLLSLNKYEEGLRKLDAVEPPHKAAGSDAVTLAAGLIERSDLSDDIRKTAEIRKTAAQIVAAAGDPRPGVVALPPAWCDPIPAGNYTIDGQQFIIPAPFRPARYPVTVAQYRQFRDTIGYQPNDPWWTPQGRRLLLGEGPDRVRVVQPQFWGDARFSVANAPVVGVSWYEATAFCAWLTSTLPLGPGQRIRLLTEAEWEVAGRWRQTRKELLDASYNLDESRYDQPSPVGLYGIKVPSGAFDMAGNVWEWCASRSQGYPAVAAEIQPDFPLDSDNDSPSLRGASWATYGSTSDPTWPWKHRDTYHASKQLWHVGFRVCLVDEKAVTTAPIDAS